MKKIKIDDQILMQKSPIWLINPGIDVNDGDSLAVTWTITVG
jgi:hypothetical protein